MSWSDWARGVLAGVQAPLEQAPYDALYAWSNAETAPYDLMRWANPLNSTWKTPTSRDSGAQPGARDVQIYPDVQTGIDATVATLSQPGYYPTIVAHLRGAVPYHQWGDACAELTRWGTGCGWLNNYYGAAPGQLSATGDDMPFLFHDVNGGGIWIVGEAGKRLVSSEEWSLYNAAGIAPHDAPGSFLSTIPEARTEPAETEPAPTPGPAVDLTPVLNAIGDLKAHPAAISDPTLAAAIATVESQLKAGLKLDIPLGSFDIKGTVGA